MVVRSLWRPFLEHVEVTASPGKIEGVSYDHVPPEILAEFSAESQELIERLSVELVELEENPDASLVSSVFRSFHTIKGSAGFLGFTQVEARAHEGESLLAQVRAGDLDVSASLVSSLLSCVDSLEREISLALEPASRPSTQSLETLDPSDQDALPATGPGGQNSADATVPDVAPVNGGGQTQSDAESRTPPSDPGSPASAESQIVRVRLDALDGLMAASGELAVARNKLRSGLSRQNVPMSDSLVALDRAVRDVQAQAARARLQPLSVLLSKLPRIVRDTASDLGKNVRVELIGASTEVDRSLIDALRDPLVHLVRNAVDHGIELPSTRASSGKPASGTITVRAWQASGSAYVAISDDGAGVNWESVRARAVQLGLLRADDVVSQEQLGAILFSAGFSTASSVSTISGRGVGLDVVHQALEDVGGSVAITSDLGSGTTVTLSMPLSLLVVSSLLFRLDGQVLAVDQGLVEEVVTFSAREVVRTAGAPSLLVRNEPVFLTGGMYREDPVLSPRKHFSEGFVLVFAHNDHRLGMLVDDVLGIEDLTVRPLDPMLRLSKSYAGAALLEDGSVVLFLDPSAVFGSDLPDGKAPLPVHRTQAAAPQPDFYLSALIAGELVALPAGEIARLETIDVTPRAGSGVYSARYQGAVLPVVNWGAASVSGACETVVLKLPSGGLVGLLTDGLCDVIAAVPAAELSGSMHTNFVTPLDPNVPALRLVRAHDVAEGLHD